MPLRDLPSVEKVLSTQGMKELAVRYQHDWLVNMVRDSIEEARSVVKHGGGIPPMAEILSAVEERIRFVDRVWPAPVINATGVIIHTNLGRVPLSKEAMEAARRVSEGYSNLELNLEEGKRGSRQAHIQHVLRQLIEVDAALVVNNNASAALLCLTALAHGKEVIVSRGEAVEIGGGFRIPDVLAQSGARLVEVGTTNRTYLSDYEAALSAETAVFLKVHTSNFRTTGFTHSTDVAELAQLGQKHGIPLIHDIGSGSLINTQDYGLAYEPRPQDSIKAGSNLVFFSGDKLLGGPQAGIIVGGEDLITRLARHPLHRALRIDKVSLAALTETLLHYLKGEAQERIPVWRMIGLSKDQLKARSTVLKTSIGGQARIEENYSTIGGGSLPGETLDTWVIAVDCEEISGGAVVMARRLREAETPVISRIENEKLILDPRTVFPEEEGRLVAVLREVLS